jgi:coenzyme F420-0:L-glutamate ligase / coenzyme F420-1:gamma-L-glutamate ligase
MSLFTDELKARRSIRRYTQQPVPLNVIRGLLEAASYAPNAHNSQPWRFIILTDPEAKAALADAMAQVWLAELEREHIPKNTRWTTVNASVVRFTSAPALILACLTLDDMDKYPDVDRQKIERDLAVQSVAAAIQNLLLAAHDNGLGACWYCAPTFCKAAVQKALALPDDVEPQALITIGYPAEVPKPVDRCPIEEFAYLDKWDNPFT